MTDPQTTTGTAVLSPEDQEVLRQARQLNARPEVISFDTIKLKNSEKKLIDMFGQPIPRGHYLIETYDAEKKAKLYRALGEHPEIVVLHRCYTYSYYEDGVGLVAWTSDIQGFTDADRVVLFSKKSGKAAVEFDGTYPEFKQYAASHYVSRGLKERKLLQFQNLLYVLFEGVVYRMFVTNASAAGIPAGEKGPSFKDPQPGSLLSFIETTRGTEMDGALCEWVCRLGSQFKDDAEQPFYLATFENAGANPKLSEALAQLKKLMTDMVKQQKDAVERLSIQSLADETKADPVWDDVPAPKSPIDVEELPVL